VLPVTQEILQAASQLYGAQETLKHLRAAQQKTNAALRETTCLGEKYTSNRENLTILRERLIASEESRPKEKRRKQPCLAILVKDQSTKYFLRLKTSVKRPHFWLGMVRDLVRSSIEEFQNVNPEDACWIEPEGRTRLLEIMLTKVLAWKVANQTTVESIVLDRSAKKKEASTVEQNEEEEDDSGSESGESE